MTEKRKICVISGSRADYGLLYWEMKEIDADPMLEIQIAVTGMHIAHEHGSTVDFIEADGFRVDARVATLLPGDDSIAVTKATGKGVIEFADVFSALKPDLILVLGDRFEIFAAAQAAMLARIPIAHIHGGEVTEGAIDESMRHAITKMAHLHFVAAESYRQRVIQMGEQPEQVYTVGAPGLDNLAYLTLMDKTGLENSLQVQFNKLLFLITYHPETLLNKSPVEGLNILLQALEAFPEASLLITKSNADAGGLAINNALDKFVEENHSRVTLVTSLGQLRYLSALSCVDVVIGNSSSGLIEAPSVGTPTVNIGDRQKGRLRAPSVIDCLAQETDIKEAVTKALSNDHQEISAQKNNPCGMPGNVAVRIVEKLKSVQLSNLETKKFFDLNIKPQDIQQKEDIN